LSLVIRDSKEKSRFGTCTWYLAGSSFTSVAATAAVKTMAFDDLIEECPRIAMRGNGDLQKFLAYNAQACTAVEFQRSSIDIGTVCFFAVRGARHI